MTSEVNSDVVAEPAGSRLIRFQVDRTRRSPPISAVLTFPALTTPNVAAAMLFAIGSSLKIISLEEKNDITIHEPKMSEHHGGAEDHSSRVGAIGAHEILSNVTTSRFEQGVFLVQ
jgi:hypothetical protein